YYADPEGPLPFPY
nr:zona pellucida-binding protein, AWN-1=C9 fragment [swine, sperm, Peptide Partial, 13 aa] [Sus scrofa]